MTDLCFYAQQMLNRKKGEMWLLAMFHNFSWGKDLVFFCVIEVPQFFS